MPRFSPKPEGPSTSKERPGPVLPDAGGGVILSPNQCSARPEARGGGRHAGGGGGVGGGDRKGGREGGAKRDECPWVPVSGFENLGSGF